MRTFALCRHAKSDWPEFVSDFDRPLNARGREDAPLLGRTLNGWGFLPDLIVSSPANRAESTARLVAKELGYDRQAILLEGSLYEASAGDVIHVLQELPDSVNNVMLFGHNPSMEMAVRMLCSMRGSVEMPTGGMVFFETAASWKHLSPENVMLKAFLFPKLLYGFRN